MNDDYDIFPIPTEAQEQVSLFRWARMESRLYPELTLLYHIPNGGSRHLLEARNLKAQGVKPGVPDICLPVPRKGCHGLYIELKRRKGGRLAPEQSQWINDLAEQGYSAAVCKGWEAAAELIMGYLDDEEE